MTGHFEECFKLTGETLAWTRRAGTALHDPELLRIRAAAMIALKRDSETTWQQAEVLLSQSLKEARESRSRLWELRTAIDLAELWNARGRRESARTLLQDIYEQVAQDSETYDVRRARTLLNALS